jgi:hypothetical protein
LTDEEREKLKDGAAAEAAVTGVEATGCCLLHAITSFALFLSASLFLLNR